jgi:hypothetical protein
MRIETENTDLSPTESTMRAQKRQLFATCWRALVVGPCIEGAVIDIACPLLHWVDPR